MVPIQENIISPMNFKDLCEKLAPPSTELALKTYYDSFASKDKDLKNAFKNLHKTLVLVSQIDFKRLYKMTQVHTSLFESYQKIQDADLLKRLASREVYATTYALKTLSPKIKNHSIIVEEKDELIHEIELENKAKILPFLESIHPDLVQPYQEVLEALDLKQQKGKSRWFSSSLRTLWDDLLLKIAPDETVRPWIEQQSKPKQKEYLRSEKQESGGKELCKPTRTSKVYYICRNKEDENYSATIVNNFKLSYEGLNRLHISRLIISDEKLKSMLIAAETAIIGMIELHRESLPNRKNQSEGAAFSGFAP